MLVGDLTCSEACRKVSQAWHEASVASRLSNAFCSRKSDVSNRSLCMYETTMSVRSIFHNVWTEVRKQEGLRKSCKLKAKRLVAFRQVAPLCTKQLMKVKFRVVDILYSIASIAIGPTYCNMFFQYCNRYCNTFYGRSMEQGRPLYFCHVVSSSIYLPFFARLISAVADWMVWP